MTVAHDLPDVYYGTKLQYATIQVNLTLSDHGLGYKDGLPVMENWETFLNEQVIGTYIMIYILFFHNL